MTFLCGFSEQLAAAASCFCHKWEDADWFLETKASWRRSRLELLKVDEHDSRLETGISAIQLLYKNATDLRFFTGLKC